MKDTYQSTLEIKPNDNFSEALRLKEKGELKGALELLENIDSVEAYSLKAEILADIKDFKKSIVYLDKALAIESDDDLLIRKADALYSWARICYFPENDYQKALKLADDALETIPEGIDASEIWFLKGEIHQSLEDHINARRCFLKAEGRFEELDALEGELNQFEIHKDDTLINITGTGFYEGLEPFVRGAVLKLSKDSENEHDPDAIAVMKDDRIVGYVANSDYTLINDVKSASEIKASIRDTSKAEVLFIFQGEFVIAKVIF